ncbi:hypothetical protein R1sor_025218 [Riccia sorocarpa]|uniref:Uncharacterized protein n=1 Tax=Riccia sorocarpa TaxID=122646 RepID=A0ABD3G7Z6_9MARC
MQTFSKTAVQLRCAWSGQSEYLECNPLTRKAEARESYLAIRFSLELGSIYVSRELTTESGEVASLSLEPIDTSKGRTWTLDMNSTNVVYGGRYKTRTSALAVPPNVIDLEEAPHERSPRSERDNATSYATPTTPISPSNDNEPYPGWHGVARDPHLLSAFDAAMTVSAANNVGKLDLKLFKFQLVLELPQRYDGNQIFELPPVSGNVITKRNGFRAGMDRRQDCFLWTRLITTEAGHGWKKQFDISHMYCVGSLRCENVNCAYRIEHGDANLSDWKTGIHRDRKYVVGDFVPPDGHRCHNFRPQQARKLGVDVRDD